MVKKGPKPVKDRSRGKIIFAGIMFGLALMGVWARAYYVQIVKGPEYEKMANRQYWTSEVVSGKRGEILDRNGLLLAKSVTTQSVSARPAEMGDLWVASTRLGKILGKNPKIISGILNSKKKFVWVDRKISDAQAQAIRHEMMPGVSLEAENSRQYPQGQMAGQLLGFLNVDGKGIEGIERFFEEILAPSSSKYTVQKDASGKRLSTSEANDRESFDGKDVRLTIDSQVQLATEEALGRAVDKSRSKYGMCMVVEIPTGEILSWANYPLFNPNTEKRANGEWKNRLAVDIFEPGSIMKPVMVAIALQEKVCTPGTVYNCEKGKWQVAGKRIKDTHSYDSLSVNKIIRYSSNIGAAKIGLGLGSHKYYQYLSNIGFAKPLGLPLPGEASGLVRPAGQWTQVDLANIAFGQGLGVTMPQMAEAYLCLANNGIKLPLRLVYEPDKPLEGTKIFDPQIAKTVMSMMEEVVQEDGTGVQARIEGVRVAGKTGTAQKAGAGGYTGGYVSSFIGIFPADKPRYLVCMMVDEPQGGHYGGVIVAPDVRNIGVQLLTSSGMLTGAPMLQAKAQSTPDKIMIPIEREVAADSNQQTMPDLQGVTVRQAVEALLAHGIVPRFSGQGILIDKQKPAPGEKWPANKQCELWLTHEPG